MANPQRENGHIDIASEIANKLREFRIPGVKWQILWCIFRQTWGYKIPGTNSKKKFDAIALSQFAQWTGLEKSIIVRSLSEMVMHKIIIKKDEKYGFNKNYDEWLHWKGHSIDKKVNGIDKKVNASVSKKPNKSLTKRSTGVSIDKKVNGIDKKVNESLTKRSPSIDNTIDNYTIDKRHAVAKATATSSFFTKVKNYYIEQFEKNFHTKPAISFGKDGAVVNRKRGLFATDKEWQLMIRWFLNSTKAEKCGNTLSVCFSTDTINKYKILKAEEEKEFNPPDNTPHLSEADKKIQDEFYKLLPAEQEKRKKENTEKLAEILKTAFKQ